MLDLSSRCLYFNSFIYDVIFLSKHDKLFYTAAKKETQDLENFSTFKFNFSE